MSDSLNIVCPNCDTTNQVACDRLAERPICGSCKHLLLPGKPLELTTVNFDRHINHSDIPVLVDFWAPWCGPCKMMTPIIDRAAEELVSSVRVAKVNTERERELATRFGIRSIPTLAVFRQGKLIDQQAGAIDLKQLLNWLNSIFA
ncbi:thioredoxin TrxC [Propionivibrio dicarboxylicus]|uniref:Thioredoxin n=1 Tax=Propionivibrio dicarboxylicus TaxID=83767 RepID=A0A1G8EYX5_9RHOO|nr:thioredoxin TrxC [Propionivibrio dicarboxylicus]SDH75105.1 thioredoxin [Propionivibrio dicarboxylicus]